MRQPCFTFRAEMGTAGPSASMAEAFYGKSLTSAHTTTEEAKPQGTYYVPAAAERISERYLRGAESVPEPHHADFHVLRLVGPAFPLLSTVESNAVPGREEPIDMPSSAQHQSLHPKERFAPCGKVMQKYRALAGKYDIAVEELLPYRVYHQVRCQIAHPDGLTSPCIGSSHKYTDHAALRSHVIDCAKKAVQDSDGLYTCLWPGCEIKCSSRKQLWDHLLRLQTHFCAETVQCPWCEIEANQASGYIPHLKRCKVFERYMHEREEQRESAATQAAAASGSGSQEPAVNIPSQ
ncbi:hypothetical protein BD626DRAFT_635148 [Schizophyllum amplum]|uniref:Uncharacterized protein n=1 Tax=Schizophyllum amplum TaxID=97359 RepID=A0A550BWZ7_9AGAR|nr:hypothetical protein BD626DRAFT_635148 [Auriculariopsis ampla]